MFSQNTNNGPPFNASIDLELRTSIVCAQDLTNQQESCNKKLEHRT